MDSEGMSLEKITSDIQSKIQSADKRDREKAVLALTFVATALFNILKKPKPGKRKKLDPLSIISILTLIGMFVKQREDPNLDAYVACKKQNPEPICRARYVVDNLSTLASGVIPGV